MGQIVIAPPGKSGWGQTPPFLNTPYRQAPPPYSYSNMAYQIATANYTPGYLNLQAGASSNQWIRMSRVNIALDLSAYSGLTWTSATLEFTPSTLINQNVWGSSNRDSVALCGQRETIRGQNTSAQDYYEIYYGSNTREFASRLPISGMSVGVKSTFTFNAAGIAYLNSVSSKPNFPGIAYLGMLFGGNVDSATPTWKSGTWMATVRMDTTVVFTLNYASTYKVNVGNTWRDASEVKINVGDSWKTVSGISVNVGDSWKDT